jgi:hypothetical protein
MIIQMLCTVVMCMLNLFSGKLYGLSCLLVEELLQMVSLRLSHFF